MWALLTLQTQKRTQPWKMRFSLPSRACACSAYTLASSRKDPTPSTLNSDPNYWAQLFSRLSMLFTSIAHERGPIQMLNALPSVLGVFCAAWKPSRPVRRRTCYHTSRTFFLRPIGSTKPPTWTPFSRVSIQVSYLKRCRLSVGEQANSPCTENAPCICLKWPRSQGSFERPK